MKKGRYDVTKNPNVKLSESVVRCIKRQLSEGTSVRCIANQYSVCTQLIYAIKNNKIWKEVSL